MPGLVIDEKLVVSGREVNTFITTALVNQEK